MRTGRESPVRQPEMSCDTRRFIRSRVPCRFVCRLSYRQAIRPSRYTLVRLASLPVSELSNDLFPQCAGKRFLARDHAGLPNRLADLVDVGSAACAVGEVALK